MCIKRPKPGNLSIETPVRQTAENRAARAFFKIKKRSRHAGRMPVMDVGCV